MLYRSGDKPALPDSGQLKAWHTAIQPIRLLFLARQREKAIKSQIEALRQRILKAHGDSPAPGFIGRYGKQWLRVLIIRHKSERVLAQPQEFVAHVGDQLPAAAKLIAVALTPRDYLAFAKWHAKRTHEDPRDRIVRVEVDLQVVDALVESGTIAKLPDGMFEQTTPKSPTIDIKAVSAPQARRGT